MRCVVHVLRPIPLDDLVALMQRALDDSERGVGSLGLTVAPEALKQLVHAAGGDARRCLGSVERLALHFRARPLGLAPLESEELIRHCRSAGLARQKIPERLENVSVLPRNETGKVLKQELRERYSVNRAGP